jgi:single-strand DNA-binding protein
MKKNQKAEPTETKSYAAPLYQNEVRIIGYLGDKPEIHDGRTVLSVATKNSWKPKDSEKFEESTDWHRVTAWGKLAEGVNALALAKGAYVLIEGELRSNTYEKDVQAEAGVATLQVKAWEIRARAIRELGARRAD